MEYRDGEELSWCPSCSNSPWQGWSCGLVHCPGGNAIDPIWRVLASSDGISSWTPLKPQHSIPCWLSVQWEPSARRSCQCCQKRDHQKFVGGFALSGLLGSGKASMLPLGHSCRSSFHRIKNCGIWIDQLDHPPAVMTTSFFWSSLSTFGTNFVQIFRIFSSSRIIVCTVPTMTSLCTYCLYRHCALIVSIDTRRSLSMKLFIWPINSAVLTSLLPRRLHSFLESLMPLKNWCSIHAR